MKKTSRFISLIIVVSMLITLIPAAVFADESEYVYFDDATVSNTLSEMEMFYLGSTNMTISEKSRDKYLMKVGRGGSLEGDADVTVKFMDITAKYGENYKVYPYDEADTLTDKSSFTVAEFINEAGSDYIEYDEEEAAMFASEYADENGMNILDKNGEVVASTVPNDDGYSILNGGGEEVIKYSENGESSETANATLDEVMENSDVEITPEEINQAENDMISDDIPGVEVTLHFADGENEKLIVVEPLYSEKAEGDAIASVVLKNPTGKMSIPEDSGLGLCIKDEDESPEPVVSLAQSEYTADGDSLEVEIKRRGRLNDLVTVHICTYSVDGGQAESGRDFQGYSAEVQLAPGMESRTVPIQIRHLYNEDSEFKVCITNPVGCNIENGEAIVHITPKEPEINEEDITTVTLGTDGEGVSLLDGENAAVDENGVAQKLDEPIPLDRFGLRGGQNVNRTWRNGQQCIIMSGVGRPGGEWQDCWVHFNKHMYDGLVIDWETYWRTPSYFENRIDTVETCWNTNRITVFQHYGNDHKHQRWTHWQWFNREANEGAIFLSETHAFNGVNIALYNVRPILRNYKFELVEPDRYLTYENVPDWERKNWQAAKYSQLAPSERIIERTLGDSFTVEKQGDFGKYAHLAALRIVVNNNEVARINNTTNTEAITVNLNDRGLMERIANNATYQNRWGRYVGSGIKVIPVYEYNNATVRVQARDDDFGYLKVRRNNVWQTITQTTDINMHVGDRLKVYSEVKNQYKDYYIPWGTHYQYCDGSWFPIKRDGMSGLIKYIPGKTEQDFNIEDRKLILYPGFTDTGNCVTVKVKNENVSLFDQAEGIFKYHEGKVEEKGGYKYYNVSGLVGPGDFVTMSAQSEVKDEEDKVTPVWFVDGKYYFGSNFYYIAREKGWNEIELIPQKNVEIKTANGKIFFEDKNIKTKYVSKLPLMPCSNGLVVGGDNEVLIGQDGGFSLDFRMFGKNAISSGGIGAKGEKCFARILVYAGTSYALRDVQIAGGYQGASLKTVNVGNINLEVNTMNAPYIEAVDAYQADHHVVETNTVTMNGLGLDLFATVRDGQKYYDAQGKELTERVLGVKFYVVDSKTHKVKTTFDAKKEKQEGDNLTTWKMSIDSFNPETPEAYTFGDVFYVSVTTDRKMASIEPKNELLNGMFDKTTYPMVSTGLQICEEKEYTPGTISMNIDLNPQSSVNGEDNASYESLPFVGGMTSILQFIANKTVMAKLNEKFKNVDPYGALTMIIKFSNLPYGGTRFQIGMSATFGNRAWSNGFTMDSFKDLANWKQYLDGKLPKYKYGDQSRGGMRTDITDEYKKMNKYASSVGRFGNLRMNVSVGIGAYVDFGNIQGNKFRSPVFIGAGGFLCVSGGVEWIWPVLIPPFKIPGYLGIEGSASFDGFLGAERDPQKLIKYSDFKNEKDTDMNQFKFAPNILLSFGVKGFVGVGIANFMGGRISVGFVANFIYSENLKKYFKAITSKTGWEIDFVVGGQIDFFGIPIKFNFLTVPLHASGIYGYYTTLGRVQKLTNYMKKSLESGGQGWWLSTEDKETAKGYINDLEKAVKENRSYDVLKALYEEAYKFATNKKMLTQHQINMLRISLNFIPNSEGEAVPETGDGVRMKHVDSEWIGSKPNDVFDNNDNGLGLLLQNSVGQPYLDMISLGKDKNDHEKLLAIFLSDTSNIGEDMKTDIYYSIYDCVDGTWQEPKSLVKTDSTKFLPKITDAGENIIVTWSEFTQAEEAAANGDALGLLDDIDVAATVLKKSEILANNEVPNADIRIITDDEYLSYPIDVDYNEKTGDTIIWYSLNLTKDGDIENYVDSLNNEYYYVIRDGEDGTFTEPKKVNKLSENPLMGLTVGDDISGDDIFLEIISNSKELSDDTTFDLMAYLRDEKGTVSKSIILDSGVYAYGIPQIITVNTPHAYFNEESEVEGLYNETTYIFWHDNDNRLKYANLSYIKESGCFESGVLNVDEIPIGNVDSIFEENNIAMMDEQIVADGKGNIYLLWTQNCIDEETANDINIPPTREVYAMTLIDPKGEDQDINAAEAWSKPYKITNDGKCADGLNAIVGEDGKVYVAYNQFSMINTSTTSEPNFEVGPTNIRFTSFKPMAKIEASDFEFSDEHMSAGDTIHVKAEFENKGLAPAKGFKTVFYECKDGALGEVIDTFNYEGTLAPTRTTEFEFDWKVPTGFENGSICCIATENGTTEETVSESIKLDNAPDLALYVTEPRQEGGKFKADCIIENNGGSVNKGYKMEVKFEGLYGDYFSRYGLETDILAEVDVPEIAPGEIGEMELEFEVPSQAFDYCGYDAAMFNLYTNEGELVTNDEQFLVLDTYSEFKMNNGEPMYIYVGETKDIGKIGDSEFISIDDEIIYSSSDETVATVLSDGKVKGLSEGTAEITATSWITGMTDTMTVNVSKRPAGGGGSGGSSAGGFTPSTEPQQQEQEPQDIPEIGNLPFTDVTNTDWFYDAVKYVYDNKIMNGTSDTTFEPYSEVTRGMFATTLFRLNGEIQADLIMPFEDVPEDEYYAEAVRWAAAAKVVNGTSKTTFEPDKLITREEMATMLYRYIQYLGGGFTGGWAFPLDFKDADQVSDWAYEAMCYLTMPSVGLMQGMEDGTLAPKNNTNRAELATVLMRYCETDKTE